MRVLWITNIILPDACEQLGLPSPVVGGWMASAARALLDTKAVELAVATIYAGRELQTFEANGIRYYLLPNSKKPTTYNPALEAYWRSIHNEFSPEVVHIHGTEYAHGLAYLRACGGAHAVVSIQGLIGVIARYYFAGISPREIASHITLRDIIKRDTLFSQKRKFEHRGIIERACLREVAHVIGRTSWDRAHALAINPNAHYHFCNETLRAPFYRNSWRYETCEKHSIFLSQAGYPIKGLHKVLQAVKLVANRYPNIRVNVAGRDITDNSTLQAKLRRGGYGSYIRQLIRQYSLTSHVHFTGPLDEEQMCEAYLRAHIFICPSAIENSPNSLGEAQILGVPTIASYAGGVPDMAAGSDTLLYRFEESEMLAQQISEIFELEEQVSTSCSIKVAQNRHDPTLNRDQLLAIYKQIQ